LDASLNVRVIKSRIMRGLGQVADMREMRNAYKSLNVKPEGIRLLTRPSHR